MKGFHSNPRHDSAAVSHADALAARFWTLFGCTPRVFRAPGRVNIIGEHTDYNDGFVLPAALDRSCWVAAAPRPGHTIVVRSENAGGTGEWDVRASEPSPSRGWTDYAIGVAVMLRRHGVPLAGATLVADSTVPRGAGLGSSAALEVAVALALADAAGAQLDPREIAAICQRAENEFAGARCGVMDQFVACHAREDAALLLDCRSLEHRHVPLPARVRLVACDTGVRHALVAGEYNTRREQCETAVAAIAARAPQVRSLRDVDAALLDACRGDLPAIVFRRCRHVLSENERVLKAAAALEHGDLAALGVLMAASHESLRNDYEVSCPELDTMVDIASRAPGVYGARMTGGGFGGCTVNLVDAEACDAFVQRVATEYARRTGRTPAVYVSAAGGAAGRAG